MTDYLVRIKVEGDATQAEAAFRKAAGAANDFTNSVSRSKLATSASTDAAKQLAAATEKAAAAKAKGSAALLAFTKAADAAKEGTFGLGKTIANVAFAFGPWGMAIGVVAQALIGLVESNNEAADAAKKHAEAMREQARAAEAAKTALIDEAMYRKGVRYEVDKATESIREQIHDYEKQIAINRSAGLSTKALSVQLIETRAREKDAIAEVADREEERARKYFSTEKALEHAENARAAREEAAALRREGEIAAIDASTESVKRNTAAKQANVAVDVERTKAMQLSLLGPNVGGSVAAFGESQQFAAGLREAQFDQTARMERGGEREGSEEAFRIEVDHLLELEEIRANSAAAQRERHEEEMRLLSEKQAKYLAHASTASTMAGSILSITDARRSAIMAAKNQGKTDREAAREGKIAALEQTAAALKGIRDMAIVKAIEQTALGIGAAATFNYASAGMHFAAAGLWTGIAVGAGVSSRVVGDRASSMGASSSGAANTSGGYGGGGSTSPRGGAPPGGNTGVPGSPGPGMPSTGGAGGSPQRTVVYQIGAVHTYGTPEREFLRRIDEGLQVEVGSNRRRAGGER